MSVYTSTETTRHTELGAFLKSRRARLRPSDVGLAPGFRRRTPGLRREEVAQMAGVGITWYTWLEQGRNIRVSPLVLCSVARALQLEPAERAHLFQLAGHESPVNSAEEAIRPAHRRVLESWDPYPALISGRRWDVLAWNRGAAVLFSDYGKYPEGQRNMLWVAFMDPGRRELYLDWEEQAARMVARFRTEAAPYLDEPAFQILIAELEAESPDFVRMWERRDIHDRTDGLKRFRHPELGRMDLEHTTYEISGQPGLRLMLYTPAAGSREETTLRRLNGGDS
ncbi:MAG: helix-turn-helix transcriptional regulator [Candidatus Dormibacteraceae bacterium]